MRVVFTCNGQEVVLETPPDRRLLDILREDRRLVGTQEGCGRGYCGSCLVFVEEDLLPACLIPAFRLQHRRVTTVDRLKEERLFQQMEAAVDDLIPPVTCRNGRLMAIYSLLNRIDEVAPEEFVVALAGTVCPGTGYRRIYERVRGLSGVRRRRWQGRGDGSRYRLPGI